MASYRLLIKSSAAKEFEPIPLKDRRRITTRIQRLVSDPRPPGVEKLSGQERYRFRQGDYRILFSINDAKLEVVIVKTGHRRDIDR